MQLPLSHTQHTDQCVRKRKLRIQLQSFLKIALRFGSITMEQQISEISLHFGFRKLTRFHFYVRQFRFEFVRRNWETIIGDVITQFPLDTRKCGLESLLECLLHFAALFKQSQKLIQLSEALAVVSENEVVHQRPRLGVKHALL